MFDRSRGAAPVPRPVTRWSAGGQRALGLSALLIAAAALLPARADAGGLVLLAPPSSALADEPPWVPLFNGRDLAGWKAHGQERWVAEGGEILGETLTKEYGYLATEKSYRDFELSAQFKAEGSGNSGIFFHSTLQGTDIKGVQVEVDPNPRRSGCPSGGTCTGGLYESGGRGWLATPTAEAEAALRPGGWNEVRAVVRGSRVQTWVNGVLAVDYTDEAPRYQDGVLALQLHSGGAGRMRFKDVRIRELR